MNHSAFNIDPDLLQRIENEYSRIFERRVPLSLSQVNKRNFHYWKEEGLIDWTAEKEDDKRSWVRLNVYDFVWIKIVQYARDFGIPLETIRAFKNELFKVIADEFETNSDEFKRIINELNHDDAKIAEIDAYIEIVKSERDDIIEAGQLHLISIFGSIISECIWKGSQLSIVFKKKKDAYTFDFVGYSEVLKINLPYNQELFNQPTLIIPLNVIINEFMGEPNNTSNLNYWGFLNAKENRVIDAIRNDDYQSIQIKRNGKEDFVIEATKDVDLKDEKAKEIQRILGLKEYEEINLVYRNAKHVFVRNKKRL